MTNSGDDHYTDSAPTAADAAVLQLAEDAQPLKDFGEQGERAVIRHPSSYLHDRVHAAAWLSVFEFAERKNIALNDDEGAEVLHRALKGLRRKTLHGVLNGHAEAIRHIQLALNHSLDVLAASRLVMIFRAIVNEPPLEGDALVREAESMLRDRAANDKPATMGIWRHPAEEMLAYGQLAEDAIRKPLITLPASATHLGVQGLPAKAKPGART